MYGSANNGIWTVDAETEGAARKMMRGVSIDSIKLVTTNVKEKESTKTKRAKKDIPDAEALLYEMDVNKCDEIITIEGFGQQKVYTRDEVEKYLGLR